MLRIRNIEAGYGSIRVLRKVSLHVNPGEIVTIIGANGAGKTTLLKAVSGLLKTTSGEIRFKGNDITNIPAERLVSLGCVLVPEGRQVFSTMTVKENLMLGATVRYRRDGKETIEKDLERIYNLFPRLAERQGQLAGTLSGGEQQMLAIGRALMSGAELIMMDEPSMGLAPVIVKEIFKTISELRNEGKTVLLVEQNARAALSISDRGYVIETGRIVLQGPAEDLLENRDVQRAYLGRDLDAEVEL
ncbi:MAG: ABC transporter ATP-binding protein [Nitrospirae bacterium]|nr:ABC transporter ATP-binding protein [Nitrospirota bacterium]